VRARATQEALIAIFRNLDRLAEPAAVFGWARAIAVREAVRVARTARRAVPAELADVPAGDDAELGVDIRDVLGRLAPEHRAILVLRDVEGLDEQAVAELLAVPTGTVKSRLFRARRSFPEGVEPMSWPVADLDAVRRLEVLAAALPGAFFAESVVDAPFETVWAVAADLEGELPRLLRNVRSARIVRSEGDRVIADITGKFLLRDTFDVVLRPGWCIMQSTRVVGGMAAVSDGDGTRFAFLGALRGPGTRVTAPLLRRVGRPLGRGMLDRLRTRVG
jgi:RNA polymerase sigma-70 factor (ECF subfamily)